MSSLPLPLRFTPSFFISYYWYIYMNTYIKTICSVCLVLLVHDFKVEQSAVVNLEMFQCWNWLHEMFPFQVSTPTGVVLVQVWFSQPLCWGTVGAPSLPFLGDTVLQQIYSHEMFPSLWCSCVEGSMPASKGGKQPVILPHSGTYDTQQRQGW